MRCITGYSSSDHERNEDTLKGLKADLVKKKLAQCKQKWRNHIRMEDMDNH
jgi:hypothetical protein